MTAFHYVTRIDRNTAEINGVRCTCGECVTQGGKRILVKRTYVCRGCKRKVPWCFGAADDMPNHCDDCWAKADEFARADPDIVAIGTLP